VERSAARFEVVSTVVLALATVATAWSAYQARQWTGEQSQAYSHATTSRLAANRTAALASRQVQIDVATFIQWIDAHAQHQPGLAVFYRRRFRPEFKPAFAAWIATNPFRNAAAPATPFALPRYRLASSLEANRLEAVAASSSQRAKDANQRADDYMLGVVLFATALFFGGISAKLDTRAARLVTLGLGFAVFIGAAVWVVATLPVRV